MRRPSAGVRNVKSRVIGIIHHLRLASRHNEPPPAWRGEGSGSRRPFSHDFRHPLLVSQKSIKPFPVLILTACAAAACTANVQPTVAQFGTAVITAQSAETAYINALNQKQIDLNNVEIHYSRYVDPQPDGTVRIRGATDALPTATVPPDVVGAINQLLKPLLAYGQAMQALAGDTAAATFDTNVDNLATQASNFDANALQPLNPKGLPTQAQLDAVAKAVKDIGNIVIAALISKDVQAAARNAQKPLESIIAGLDAINVEWSKEAPATLMLTTVKLAVAQWNRTPPALR
jgi:hypothetical protein